MALLALMVISEVTMADHGPGEDQWLTLAEIAEELRMSPSTVRSWVSSGTLRATRPGKRKWLVRRSELERMLRGDGLQGPDAEPGAAPMDTISPPGRSPHWPSEAVEHVTPTGWLGASETEWRAALRRSASAPPDAGFPDRVRLIAEATARKAAGLANLDDADPGPWWHRQSGIPDKALSYELRPGANRPGPVALWAQVDSVVEELDRAMREHSLPAEQAALEALSLVLHEIADALADSGTYPWPEVLDRPDGSR
jgi:excisionase family DNA binding protein